jgi:hypothetical protein
MYSRLLVVFVVLALSTGVAPAQHTYSKGVQKACANDYKRHCGQYGIETQALRLCMDRTGQRLTKTCVDALSRMGRLVSRRLSGTSVVAVSPIQNY